MSNVQSKPALGELKISQEVIAAVAKVAVLETKGVDSLAAPPASRALFSKKPMQKAIGVSVSDDFVTVSVCVNLKFGASIKEVCASVQTAVKDNVQSMTGMAVSKVNVLVAGICFPAENGE